MLRRLWVMLCVCVVSVAVAEEKTVSALPKNWRLLVVKRAHCPHCVQWINQVYLRWKKLHLDSLVSSDAIEIIDAEVDADVEKLVSYVNTRKLRDDVSSVPAYIILDETGKEGQNCRFDGYSSYRSFRDQLSETITRCKTKS